jgi:hypothetical protein
VPALSIGIHYVITWRHTIYVKSPHICRLIGYYVKGVSQVVDQLMKRFILQQAENDQETATHM